MATELDLLALAEDVAAGRRSLDNVIDQIAVATPDDRARRAAVAELQSLVLGLTGVQAHANATADATGRGVAPRLAPAGSAPGGTGPTGAVRSSVSRPRRGPMLAGGASLLAVAVVLVLAVGVLRPGGAVGGPSASPGGSASSAAVAPSPSQPAAAASATSSSPAASSSLEGSPSGAPSSVKPSSSPVGAPTSGVAVQPPVAIWRGSIGIDRWDATGINRIVTVNVRAPALGFDTYRVLASPDGSRFAISERAGSDPGRVRIVDASGTILWSMATGMADALDLAWSADGTEFAVGQQPGQWTVVTFRADGTIQPRAYHLGNASAYRLIAFTGDGTSIVGYETSGEAEFWEKPVELDLGTGGISPITTFPAGLAAASTGPVQLIDRATGAVLARTGGAKGAPTWVVRHGTSETPVNVGGTADLAWTDDGRILVAEVDPVPTADGRFVTHLSTLASPDATSVPLVDLPPGFSASPVGVRDGAALLTMFPAPGASYPVDPGYADLALVNLATGAVTYAQGPPTSVIFTGLSFGGWLDR